MSFITMLPPSSLSKLGNATIILNDWRHWNVSCVHSMFHTSVISLSLNDRKRQYIYKTYAIDDYVSGFCDKLFFMTYFKTAGSIAATYTYSQCDYCGVVCCLLVSLLSSVMSIRLVPNKFSV